MLVLMHWLFGTLAERSDLMGRIVKGRADTIMEKGKCVRDDMRAHHITRRDIKEAARRAGIKSLDDVGPRISSGTRT